VKQVGKQIGRDGGGNSNTRFSVGWSLPASTPRGLGCSGLRQAGRPDPFEQHARWFVVGVLGHQLTAERLGQQRRPMAIRWRLEREIPAAWLPAMALAV
jgi:hypothetical protein